MITIHYDFVNGTEISFIEGKEQKDNFTTNCLSFFSTDNEMEVIVLKKDGSYISKNELLIDSSFYTDKEIRVSHNIEKILRDNGFEFKI